MFLCRYIICIVCFTGGSIPDAALIHAARKHRQQARELGGLADYIKLDDSQPKQETEQVSVTSARLVREDENDKSDEEEGEDGRVDFSVDLLKKDKQKRREAFLAAEQEDEDNMSDEDEDDWERQQFQKAIRQRQLESAHQQMALEEGKTERITSANASAGKSMYGPSREQRAPSSVSRPDVSKLNPLPSASELQEKLRQRLTTLEEVNRRHKADQERFEADLISSYEEIERIESENPKLSDRFYFVQDTRNYVNDLTDCLTSKIYEVESLENRWMALLLKRHRYLVDRRRADVNDENGDCVLFKVIGQTANPEKISRTAEREARRQRRRLNRKESGHKEGQSSDDEAGDEENSMYLADRQQIQLESRKIFENTLDEFSTLEAITKRFGEWRLEDDEFYRDCYVERFVPRLASCIVRAAFLQSLWNPLEHEITRLKKSHWFQTLAQYDLDNSSSSKDSTFLTISKTVETVVIPYINQVVKAAYDPCSISQTNRLVELVKSLMDDHPSLTVKTPVLQCLEKAVVEKFETSVDKDVFIPFQFASDNPAFVNRQFWSAAKLFRNILYWQKMKLIEDSTLRANAVDKVFKKNMLLALTKTSVKGSVSEPETLNKVSYMAKALPKSWLGPLSPYAAQLQPLIDVTMSLAQNADSSTSSGRKQIHGVVSVLKSLGAVAEAQEINAKYL